jgi:predicted MPP superfamily phosphohydrolase
MNSIKQPHDPERRAFLKAALAATGLVGLGFSGYSWAVEGRWLANENLTLPVENLPSALEGIRIVHLSDFHYDSFTDPAYMARVVDAVNRTEPDVIALTGDFVTDRAEAIYELAPILSRLRARYGSYSCLGNHDLWTGVPVVIDGLESAGITVLRNSGTTLDIGGEPLYLAGLDDAWSGRPDLRQALQGAPNRSTVVLLAHEPDGVDIYAHNPRIKLQLSGHSHGGQVRIPGLGALNSPSSG